MLFVYLLQDTFVDKSALNLLCAEIVVASNVNAVNLNLVFPFNVDVYDNLVGSTGIVSLYDVYLCVLVAFLLEIPLC